MEQKLTNNILFVLFIYGLKTSNNGYDYDADVMWENITFEKFIPHKQLIHNQKIF